MTGSPPDISSDARTLMARLDELGRVSTDPGRLNRQPYTAAHRQAIELVAGWMQAAGMATRVDAIGNLIGRYEGEDPAAPVVLIGSHLDTVVDAGRYDGALGVLAGVQVVAALHDGGERLPFPVEVVAFCDEEGVRFPTTFLGSKAICGTLDPGVLELPDGAGVTVGAALRAFGGDPDALASVAYPPGSLRAFLEVHIEQGPVLEAEDRPLGIVTAIQGQSRLAVVLDGMAGHAGTVPMGHRRDALAGAAEIALLVERRCSAAPDLVGTVGRLEVLPGAVNVIPGRAMLTLDIRSPSDLVRGQAVAELVQAIHGIAAARGLGCTVAREHDQPANVCAPRLQRVLAQAMRAEGVPVKYLPSGAGHDAMAMAAICPTAMLFVRCGGGISHNPLESMTLPDADLALRVLLRALRLLALPKAKP
ncbi:allantoate amidohydrolase [Geminicoccus harenae]|uniref:allantoate amidohydrolase n=3 Tax=Geminicoccus harenae TaxID=2498453 RepID=UPI001C941BEB|nr:allantoate amidohydrolase [Geminicoccus harenae]